jgi:hypothetical protein
LQKKDKQQLPTVEEFLGYKPRRLDFKWETTKEGLVRIIVPKFKSKLGKKFCKILKKDSTFGAEFDKLGSVVWKNCNGTNTVKEILDIVSCDFPDEDDLDQRLFLFLQQMKGLGYIDF